MQDSTGNAMQKFIMFQQHKEKQGKRNLNYGTNIRRLGEYNGTTVINCCGRYDLYWNESNTGKEVSRLQKLFVRNYEEIGM